MNKSNKKESFKLEESLVFHIFTNMNLISLFFLSCVSPKHIMDFQML